MDNKTYIHTETGERQMMDANRPDARRMEESDEFQTEGAGAGTRIVETADPEKASRIGYQNPAGNTSASTADLNTPHTPGSEDAEDDEESAEDEETEQPSDEFDAPPSTFDRKS